MKHSILTAALLLLFCTASNAEDRDLPEITVYGTATTMVTPDTMSWELTVRNIGRELPAVASSHAEIVQNVLKLLKKLKVPDDGIQTARMEFGENWVFRNKRRIFRIH